LAVVQHARPSARQGRRNNHPGTHRGSARFADLLDNEPEADLFDRLRAAESIGRPLGSDRFLSRIERSTRRDLKPGKRGPKAAEAKSVGKRER
jgi:hypothetical protein